MERRRLCEHLRTALPRRVYFRRPVSIFRAAVFLVVPAVRLRNGLTCRISSRSCLRAFLLRYCCASVAFQTCVAFHRGGAVEHFGTQASDAGEREGHRDTLDAFQAVGSPGGHGGRSSRKRNLLRIKRG